MVSVPQRVLGDPLWQDASLENGKEASRAGGKSQRGWDYGSTGPEVYKRHSMGFGLTLAFFRVVSLTGVCVLLKMYENPSD